MKPPTDKKPGMRTQVDLTQFDPSKTVTPERTRIYVRMPIEMKKELQRLAKTRRQSFNNYCLSVLSTAKKKK